MPSSRSCRSTRPGRSRSPPRAASPRCRGSSSAAPPLKSPATSRSWRSCRPATRTCGSGCSRRSWRRWPPAAGCRRRGPGSRATSSSAPTPTTRSAGWPIWRRCDLAIRGSCRSCGLCSPTATPTATSVVRPCSRLSVPATKGCRRCSNGLSTIPRFRRRQSKASPPFPATAPLPRSWPPTRVCRRSAGRRRSPRSRRGLPGRSACSTPSPPPPCRAVISRRSLSAGSRSRPTHGCSRGSTRSGARSGRHQPTGRPTSTSGGRRSSLRP